MADFRLKSRCGTSFVELMVATGVFLIAVMGILFSYVKAMELNSIGKTAVVASHAVKNKMEEIKGSNLQQLAVNYDRVAFTTAGLTGRGVSYVDMTNAPLVTVKVAFCWRLGSGRVVGEDANLNGVLDSGEDRNGNGQIDSYVQLVTQLYGG